MRRAMAVACATLAMAAMAAGPAGAAKTYDDPWLEGDLQQMRVPQALDILARTPDHVVVADVDSGVLLTDPDLAPHLLKMPKPATCTDEYGPGPSYAADPANGDFGCDFIGAGQEGTPSTIPDGDPSDPFGHGTGVAEIVAGVPNNGVGGAGVAPNARVLPVRACYGGGPDCFNEPALDGLRYAVDMGAKVINGSWPPGNDYSAVFRAFIKNHPAVLFVFAIGGSDQNADPYTLCTQRTTYPNVMCVGLVEPDDTAGTINAEQNTDVSAPGYAGVPNKDGAKTDFGYTSGATAHVSGAAALLMGIAPSLTPSQIRQALVTTSRAHAGYDTANRAKGIVDVAAAVRSVQTSAGLTTPAEGQGAPVDSPNPFPAAPGGGGNGGGGGGGGTTTTTGTTSTPATTTTTTPATTPPSATASPTPSGATPAAKPGVTFANKLPSKVRAGATLRLSLKLTGYGGTVSATLTRGKSTLAKTTRRGARGAVTLSLRLKRRAPRGKAKLTVRLGSATALVRTISVTR